MKITKSFLKQIIKEEFSRLQEDLGDLELIRKNIDRYKNLLLNGLHLKGASNPEAAQKAQEYLTKSIKIYKSIMRTSEQNQDLTAEQKQGYAELKELHVGVFTKLRSMKPEEKFPNEEYGPIQQKIMDIHVKIESDIFSHYDTAANQSLYGKDDSY